MSAPEIIAALVSSYAAGWAWGASMLAFKRFSETSTS